MTQAMDNDRAAIFWRDGYRLADALVTPAQCAFLRRCMDVSQRTGRMRDADNAAYRGPNNEYALPAAQALLSALAPRVGALVGRELLPAYAFWRIYERGAQLHRHRDRAACEVSATITLASDPVDSVWPFGVTALDGVDREVAVPVGCGLLYQGPKVPHWRGPLSAERHYQLFLHYVVAGGPYAALAHDAAGVAEG